MTMTATPLRPAAVTVYPDDLGVGDLILVGADTLTVENVLRDTGARTGYDFVIVTARAPGSAPVELLCGERDSVLRLEVA